VQPGWKCCPISSWRPRSLLPPDHGHHHFPVVFFFLSCQKRLRYAYLPDTVHYSAGAMALMIPVFKHLQGSRPPKGPLAASYLSLQVHAHKHHPHVIVQRWKRHAELRQDKILVYNNQGRDATCTGTTNNEATHPRYPRRCVRQMIPQTDIGRPPEVSGRSVPPSTAWPLLSRPIARLISSGSLPPTPPLRKLVHHQPSQTRHPGGR
jgi:hypothetical protein